MENCQVLSNIPNPEILNLKLKRGCPKLKLVPFQKANKMLLLFLEPAL